MSQASAGQWHTAVLLLGDLLKDADVYRVSASLACSFKNKLNVLSTLAESCLMRVAFCVSR